MSSPAGIRFACQTYSWQMSGELYRDRIDHIATTAAEAGFPGLEIDTFMLGQGFRDRQRLSSTLVECGLELVALAHAAEWHQDHETESERAEADEIITLLGAFPGAKLVLVQLPGADRADLRERQRLAIACMNAVGRRALAAGLQPTVHPNSPPGSLFRTAEDYEILLDGLDTSIRFTPDVGHIAAGGMDALETVRRYRNRVDHIHFKDMHSDGSWAATGSGQLDFVSIVSFLAQTGYEGWVVFEDECEDAHRNPDVATHRNGAYARDVLMPLLSSGTGTRSAGSD